MRLFRLNKSGFTTTFECLTPLHENDILALPIVADSDGNVGDCRRLVPYFYRWSLFKISVGHSSTLRFNGAYVMGDPPMLPWCVLLFA
jgi:hypothetical protein